MKNTWVVASTVLKDTVRKKLFLIVLLFGIIILGLVPILPSFELGLRWQFLVDMSLSLTSIFAVILAVVLSVNQIRRDIDKRTVYNVISKPVSRLQYIIGKYMGVVIALAAVLLIIGVEILLLVLLRLHVFKPQIFIGIIAIFLEAALLSAFCIAVSTFASVPISVFSTILFYLLFHNGSIMEGDLLGARGGGWKVLVWGLEYLVPNLNRFNLADEIGYGQGIAWSSVLMMVLYALLFIVFLLFIGYGVFRKSNL